MKQKPIPPKPPDRPVPPDRAPSNFQPPLNQKLTQHQTETSNPSKSMNTLNSEKQNENTPLIVMAMNRTSKTMNTMNKNKKTMITMNNIDMENDMSKKGTMKPIIRNLLKLSCIINEWNNATVMIDSGAACNCISRTYIENHNIEILESEPYQVTLANKSTTTTNEICLLNMEVPGMNRKFNCVAIVLPELSSSDMILGMPFLEVFNPTIDWKKKKIQCDMNKMNRNEINVMNLSVDVLLSSFSIGTESKMNKMNVDMNLMKTNEQGMKSKMIPVKSNDELANEKIKMKGTNETPEVKNVKESSTPIDNQHAPIEFSSSPIGTTSNGTNNLNVKQRKIKIIPYLSMRNTTKTTRSTSTTR